MQMAKLNRLEREQVLGTRPFHCGECNRAVERDQPPASRNRERQQVGVSQLARPVHVGRVHEVLVEQAHVVRPELVRLVRRRRSQSGHDFSDGVTPRIRRVRENSHAAVLRDRTRRPALTAVLREPGARRFVRGVVGAISAMSTLTSSRLRISTRRRSATGPQARW